MVSIIPESQISLAERLAVAGCVEGFMELGHTDVTVNEDSSVPSFVLAAEDSETESTLKATLDEDPHPAFGYSVDAVSLGGSIKSESFGSGNILVEPSVKKAGSVEIWADITKKCYLRQSRSVVLVDNGENAELIEGIIAYLHNPDYVKVANDLSIEELIALSQKCVAGISSTPGGLLLLLTSMTPFLHVYSNMHDKKMIEDMELGSFGFNYQMLDKGQSPAVITAKLVPLIEDEMFLRKEIEKFRVFMRHEFLGVLRELLA